MHFNYLISKVYLRNLLYESLLMLGNVFHRFYSAMDGFTDIS